MRDERKEEIVSIGRERKKREDREGERRRRKEKRRGKEAEGKEWGREAKHSQPTRDREPEVRKYAPVIYICITWSKGRRQYYN